MSVEDRTEVEERRAEVYRLLRSASDEKVLAMGGAVAAVENAYMKQRLVESQTRRYEAIESGEQSGVGVNEFTETAE